MGKVKNLPPDNAEPGSKCPIDGCTGTLDTAPAEDCSCPISPPCGSCLDAPLVCDTCHEEFPND